ncbi:MAG: hypothetical protein KC505_02580 [Myxococcales bacterium]|nr:hypothetical protein [Myxococcales bacterium]USN50748.1 MAG: hypothetical protein H6731_10905 [Myxococcales bacterium]
MMHRQKYTHYWIAILIGMLTLASCSNEPQANLDEASDTLLQPENNKALEGRGSKERKKEKSKDKKPRVPPPASLDPEHAVASDENTNSKDESLPVVPPKVPVCGDGFRDIKTEECDDHNLNNGDGCSAECISEAHVVKSSRKLMDIGYAHVCLIDTPSKQLKCWGLNNFGQLGQENIDEAGSGLGTAVSSLKPINIGEGLSVEFVAAGGNKKSSSTCIINNKNEVQCFGSNSAGQLGQGSTAKFQSSLAELNNFGAVKLGKEQKIIDIDSGAGHQCALLENGTVKCWGLNNFGQLGLGNEKNIGDTLEEMGSQLRALPLKAKTIALALGGHHSCALTSDYEVKCWGLNSSGQLGQNHSYNLGDNPFEVADIEPIEVNSEHEVHAITAGAEHTCALLDDGSIKCWGNNSYGQLGQGHVLAIGDEAGEMQELNAINFSTNKATAIAAGDYFNCALFENGEVKCWGDNRSGQLGQDSNSIIGDEPNELSLLTPINLRGRKALSIAAGGSTACAVLDDGDLTCWGENNSGQLGINTTDDMGDNLGEMAELTSIDTGY